MKQGIRSVQGVGLAGWVITGLLMCASGAMAENAPMPPLDEIRDLYAVGQYGKAMMACRRIICLKDDSPAGFDRHNARMLCAECQLRPKLIKGAGETLDAASAAAEKMGNPADLAQARALALLVHSSPNLMYVPRNGSEREPLNILDPSTRHAAYLSLLADKLNWCKTRQRESAEYETLTPLLALANTFAGVRAVEQVANGSTAQSDALGVELSSWSGKMVASVLTRYDSNVTRIVADTNVGPNRKVHRGKQTALSSAELVELNRILEDCQRVPAAIDTLNAAFAQPLASSADANRGQAQNLVDRINAIVEENGRVSGGQAEVRGRRRR